MDMYVRDASEIEEKYISNNKVSYLKETANINGIKLNYYYDGTIEVIKNNTSYIVRNENDLKISNDDVIFPNNNEATIVETQKLADGKKIYYYSDGGAIIEDGNQTLSVRKSNSIIIKDNKLISISGLSIKTNSLLLECFRESESALTLMLNFLLLFNLIKAEPLYH